MDHLRNLWSKKTATNNAGVKVQTIRKRAQIHTIKHTAVQESAKRQVNGSGFFRPCPNGSMMPVSANSRNFSMVFTILVSRNASILKRKPPVRHIDKPMTLHIFGILLRSIAITHTVFLTSG